MKTSYRKFKERIEELASEMSDYINSVEPSEGIDEEGLDEFYMARYNTNSMLNLMVEDITDGFGTFLDD